MSENSAASHAGASSRTREAGPGASPSAPLDAADMTVAPDMTPVADAFGGPSASGPTTLHGSTQASPVHGMGLDAVRGAMAALVLAVRHRGLARIPGQRRHWLLAGLVVGGILLGGLASGGVAWKIISDRDAQIAATTAHLDLQSIRISEQETRIEMLTREVKERPPPAPPLVTEQAAAPVPLQPSLPAGIRVPAPAGLAAGSPRPSTEGSPSIAGSGICDVPAGIDAAPRIRMCLDWFAGRDTPATRPVP
jgi:hypothetical protein